MRSSMTVTEQHLPAGVLSALASVGELAFSGLSDDDVALGMRDLLAGADQLLARALAYVAEADRRDVATGRGAVNTVGLVRSLSPHPVSGAEASRLVKLARRLEKHPDSRTAALSGQVSVAQAEVVTAAVADLPTSVGEQVRQAAEDRLLTDAKSHPVADLKVLGKHVLDVLDPAAADAKLAARLEAEERAARRKTELHLRHDGEGMTYGRFRIPTFQGILLETMLHALLNPKRPDPIPAEAERTIEFADPETGELHTETQRIELDSPERMGMAFCGLIDRIPVSRLPKSGGGLVKVVVTIPLATMLGGLASAAVLGVKRGQLSPGEARRLACRLGVIPMVLGTDSIVLDAGRQQRLHDDEQRTAMVVQQHGTCGITDCDRPAIWGEAHHPHAWASGGSTNTADGVILCPRHHSLAHSSHLKLTRHPDQTWTLERTGRKRR